VASKHAPAAKNVLTCGHSYIDFDLQDEPLSRTQRIVKLVLSFVSGTSYGVFLRMDSDVFPGLAQGMRIRIGIERGSVVRHQYNLPAFKALPIPNPSPLNSPSQAEVIFGSPRPRVFYVGKKKIIRPEASDRLM